MCEESGYVSINRVAGDQPRASLAHGIKADEQAKNRIYSRKHHLGSESGEWRDNIQPYASIT